MVNMDTSEVVDISKLAILDDNALSLGKKVNIFYNSSYCILNFSYYSCF